MACSSAEGWPDAQCISTRHVTRAPPVPLLAPACCSVDCGRGTGDLPEARIQQANGASKVPGAGLWCSAYAANDHGWGGFEWYHQSGGFVLLRCPMPNRPITGNGEFRTPVLGFGCSRLTNGVHDRHYPHQVPPCEPAAAVDPPCRLIESSVRRRLALRLNSHSLAGRKWEERRPSVPTADRRWAGPRVRVKVKRRGPGISRRTEESQSRRCCGVHQGLWRGSSTTVCAVKEYRAARVAAPHIAITTAPGPLEN